MENFAKHAAALLATALVAGALIGCAGQTAPSDSTASESASAQASASADESAQASAETATETEGSESGATSADAPDEVVAALQAALKGTPAYKSVTLTEQRTVETFVDSTTEESDSETTYDESAYDEDVDSSTSASSAAAQNQNIIESTRIAKFDTTSGKAKTSSSINFSGTAIKEYVTGDKAVVAFDGETYGGTVEEMSAQELTSVDAFLNARIGDMDVLATCLADATISDENGNTRYDLKVSPTAFAQTDKEFASLVNIGYLLNDMSVSYLFDTEGKLLEASLVQDTNFDVTNATIAFSNYDATTVEAAPKATKTYADMSADVKAAIESESANGENANGEGSSDETANGEESN